MLTNSKIATVSGHDAIAEVDDTHQRWKNQSGYQNVVWNYFNDVVAKEIISKALEEKTTLADLYQTLAIARAKCEWIKQNKYIDGAEIDIAELMKAIVVKFPDGFGYFQYGDSAEKDLLAQGEGGWGEAIIHLLTQRMGSNGIDARLSVLQMVHSVPYELWHPCGAVLHKLEQDFQALCDSTNFFDYVKNAAWLSYVLSNFPPVMRGSAAVTTWILDKIAQIRFDFTSSIRPYLYDWIAFYESADQYINFYAISAAAAYIKSLNIIPEMEAFSKKMIGIMENPPDAAAVINERKQLWEELKEIINKNLHKLDIVQQERFIQITEGHLEFGLDIKQAMNKAKAMVANSELNNLLENPLLRWGYVQPENVDQFASLLAFIEKSKILQQQIVIALKNGMKLTELNKLFIEYHLSESHLEALTSRAAILLHHINIPIKKFFSVSPEETENNILRLVASEYAHEELQDIAHPGIRKSLLRYMDSCFFKHLKMTDLTGDSVEATNRKLLMAYLNHQYFINDPDFVNGLNDERIIKGLNIIISIDKNDMYNWDLREFLKYPVPDDQGLLYFACANGNIEIVERCLTQRVDFNAEKIPEYTPLYRACMNGHTKIVKLLLQRTNADITQDAIDIACSNGHDEILKCLLNKARFDVNKVNLLEIACHRGHEKIVEWLLEDKDIDFNQKDCNATKLFKRAVYSENVKVVELFLKRPDIKINHNKTSDYDETPFYIACNLNCPEIVKLLLEEDEVDVNQVAPRPNDRLTPLYNACLKGHITLVELLLQSKKIDVNFGGDDDDGSPLHACVTRWGAKASCISLLLEHQADMRKINYEGKTALDITISKTNYKHIFIFLLHAIKKDLPLDCIMSAKSLKKVKILIDSPEFIKANVKSKCANTLFSNSLEIVMKGIKDYVNGNLNVATYNMRN